MALNETRTKLIRLLADGAFHSGSDLARRLDVSRSAVWKQVQALAGLGLEICALSGKGYRLRRPLELLDRTVIASLLKPSIWERIGRLEIYERMDSTNRYLIDGVEQGMPNGSVCLAEMQTAGRGRCGRQWISPFGRNIYLSLLCRFSSGPGGLSGLSLAAGVAVLRALSRNGVSGLGLKWPNDILWRQRKLGGILIEVGGEVNGPCAAVIGLGLNFYIPEESGRFITQGWVDLERIQGEATPSRNALIAEILNDLLAIVADYEETGITPYLEEWRGWDCVVGENVTLHGGQSEIKGEVKGITDEGLLIVRKPDGTLSHYASGEVSFSGESS